MQTETPWYHANYYLGIPSTIFAAIAGITALAEGPRMVTGGIALCASALSALHTFLDPNKRAMEHHATAKCYEALYHAFGRFLRLTLTKEDLEPDATEKALAALTTRFDEVLRSSPPLPETAYKTAAANFRKGTGEVLRVPNDCDANS